MQQNSSIPSRIVLWSTTICCDRIADDLCEINCNEVKAKYLPTWEREREQGQLIAYKGNIKSIGPFSEVPSVCSHLFFVGKTWLLGGKNWYACKWLRASCLRQFLCNRIQKGRTIPSETLFEKLRNKGILQHIILNNFFFLPIIINMKGLSACNNWLFFFEHADVQGDF